jgi:hypothetical protein
MHEGGVTVRIGEIKIRKAVGKVIWRTVNRESLRRVITALIDSVTLRRVITAVIDSVRRLYITIR